MSDVGERTEKGSARHIRELVRDGKLGRSHELSAWLGLGAACLTIPAVVASAGTSAVTQFLTAMAAARRPDPAVALAALADGLGSALTSVSPLLAAAVAASLAGALVQGGLRLRRLRPHTEQFNLAKGVGRLFGRRAWWNGATSLAKTLAVGGGLYVVVQGLVPLLLGSGTRSLGQLTDAASAAVAQLLVAAIGAGLAIAALDALVVLRRNRRQTMVTKRQARDELKHSEGDPLVRQQRRSRQLAASRTRMIQAVSGASVVMVNPTHYAVALLYEPGRSAPRVVAKGQGVVAQRIREEAEARRVPIVKDVPLTRALHRQIPLGAEITVEFYTAIAQVLTFVAMLKRRGAASGVHELPGGFR